ncbi:MAG: thiolase domain-containing protein, partial [bacterium]|nr:thiolase domain-containing protein [bacterium]
MRDVAIIGIGIHKWGELWEKSIRDIFVEAGLNAIDDSGVDHIDSMYVGSMSPGLFVGQEHLGPMMADYLGVAPIPSTRVESACASGGAAIRAAFLDVASGMNDIVLAGGVEKMLDVDGNAATAALATAADQEYEVYNGATFPGLYAMMARAHMDKYGTTSEQLAAVAVKNHANGSLNPNAQFPTKITVEQVMNSIIVCDPLHILDCSPITDGAAAVIMCPLDMAKNLTDKPVVKISGIAMATDTIALHHRKDPAWIASAEIAAKKAFDMAGKNHDDID